MLVVEVLRQADSRVSVVRRLSNFLLRAPGLTEERLTPGRETDNDSRPCIKRNIREIELIPLYSILLSDVNPG